MFERMRILSGGDLAVGALACAVLGGALGITAYEQYQRSVATRPAIAAHLAHRPPVIERSTERETLARVPLRIDGREIECRLAIDHRTRLWSLAC